MTTPGTNRQVPVIISTIRDYYRYGYQISVECIRCKKWKDLDLPELIEAGRGDQPLATAEFRCADCGRPGDVIVQTNDRMTRGEAPAPLSL